MSLLFVTGSNAGFFNSLLICLQSFTERLPTQRLLVCDYGLTEPQATFLRELGVLMERPPSIAPLTDVFICKAALLRYLHHAGHQMENYDAIVWIDGDLTLMDVGLADFDAVVHAMQQTDTMVAICPDLTGRSLGQMIEHFDDATVVAPFANIIDELGIDRSGPYFSTGLFFCRSTSILESWDKLTSALTYHPLFEQNMFNVVLHRDHVEVVLLDCEGWQAQGHALEHIRLVTDAQGRPKALVGNKNIKTLHSTSPLASHLLIIKARMSVRDLELTGIFKLLFAEPLRMVQLNLLAQFVHLHAEQLKRLGLCQINPNPIEGFQFTSLS